jgi:conjugal transfer pilus assembly protein TraW
MNMRCKQYTLIIFLIIISPLSVFSKDLGNYGQVFSIDEKDIRKVILDKLKKMEKTGELSEKTKEINERVAEHIKRPTPLNLPTTNHPMSFKVDPSIILSKDIITPTGELIAKKGTLINPFKHIQYKKTLFFFNGDDVNQVRWAIKNYGAYDNVKFILTGGDIRQSANIFGRIYFDVGGQLTHKLSIKHVPSIVSQEGFLWKIEEIEIKDV